MKNNRILIALFCLLPFFGNAQSISDEVALIQSAFGMEKQALVKEAMQLSEEKQQAFWDVYRAYEEERRALSRERLGIIADYADNFQTMNDAKAEELARRLFKADIAVSKLQNKYFTRFRKATTGLDAAKFMQIDRHIHATIRVLISDSMPFLVEKQ